MNQKSFNKAVSIVTLVFFLGTPIGVFAQTYQQLQQQIQALQIQVTTLQSGPQANQPQTQSQVQALQLQIQQLQQQQQYVNQYPQQPYYGGGSQQGGAGNALGQLGFLSMLGGLGSGGAAGGNNQLLSGLAIGSMLGGGGFGGAGGGGPLGSVSQALTLAGALSGNVGLMLAGMITSMIGGLVGGAGGTPQRGAVDEGYVAPGQAGPYGAGYGSGGYNPYYSPVPTATPVPVASCEKTIFIVKDTTVTPNTVKPYPTAVEIPQNQCVLAINSDTGASHTVQVKEQDTVKATQSIDKEKSHIFRFENKKTYTLCVDAVAAACTTVTVK